MQNLRNLPAADNAGVHIAMTDIAHLFLFQKSHNICFFYILFQIFILPFLIICKMQTRKAAPESKLRPSSHYFSASEKPHLLKPAFSARFPFFSPYKTQLYHKYICFSTTRYIYSQTCSYTIDKAPPVAYVINEHVHK